MGGSSPGVAGVMAVRVAGILVCEPLFGFVPNVAGTWTLVDQISGATGKFRSTVP